MPLEKHKVHIQHATADSLLLTIDGVEQRIQKRLDALQDALKSVSQKTIQTADKIYNIEHINEANFELVVDRLQGDRSLPEELQDNLIKDEVKWPQSLYEALLKEGVSVRNRPRDIFSHYGWLIEVFLLKLYSTAGRERSLQRLSYLTEAYETSLRYLCYIQLAKLIALEREQLLPDCLGLAPAEFDRYDLLSLLVATTQQLPVSESFLPELYPFVEELADKTEDLYATALFLEQQRTAFQHGHREPGDQLEVLLDQYQTALVYWLRRIAFVSRYRLVSIKDINLRYRVGGARRFVHIYGELHGMYDEDFAHEGDFTAFSVEDSFTYNQSVLLFKGDSVESVLRQLKQGGNYLSLSPLIIDGSVFRDQNLHTPEIYYYAGFEKRRYYFNHARNETWQAEAGRQQDILAVKRENDKQPLLNELHEQMERIFAKLKAAAT
jgi:hypothetical protein